jgi:acetylornithine deacetylase/succinyl-diaminopimelate desuccinylase family protein
MNGGGSPGSVERLLADLVAIPSMNPMGRDRRGPEYAEGAIASLVADHLRGSGVDTEVTEVSPGRPNVVGRIDVGARQTVLLEAHLDTVHADAMEIPPFSAEIRNGRLYGRGACDTKGSLAAFLHVVCEVARRRSGGPCNLIFAAVADEEYGFTGARKLAEELRADFGIVGEPTRLRVVRAHKGVLRWRIATRGISAHSAYPERGKNAIYEMARVVSRLEEYAATLQQREPHPLLGFPTLSVGVIEGGEAVNVVPARCRIEIDRRMLPGETEESALEEVRHALAGAGEWEHPHLSVPGMEVPENDAGLRRLAGAIASATGTVVVETAPYATDAGIYGQCGVRAVVFGPGDIADAHTSRESIDLAEVVQATNILRRVCSA